MPVGRVLLQGLQTGSACSAFLGAVEPHAGTARQEFSAIGEALVQQGKDLLDMENLIDAGDAKKYLTKTRLDG